MFTSQGNICEPLKEALVRKSEISKNEDPLLHSNSSELKYCVQKI